MFVNRKLREGLFNVDGAAIVRHNKPHRMVGYNRALPHQQDLRVVLRLHVLM